MDESRSAQRYLEDLTPGGSEYFDNPKRCYETVLARIESAHRIAMEAALERNRLREENKRLRAVLDAAETLFGSLAPKDAPIKVPTQTLIDINNLGQAIVDARWAEER